MASWINFKNATLAAMVESMLIHWLYPEHVAPFVSTRPSMKILTKILFALALNYCLLCLYSTLVYPRFLSQLRHVPRPKFFIPRLVYSILFRGQHQSQVFLDAAQSTPNDGLIMVNTGISDKLLVTSMVIVGELLVRRSYDFMKPENVRNFMRHFLGDGLILVEGDRHRLLRKKSQPAFGYRQIRDMYPMMWTKALMFQEAIAGEVQRQSTELDQKNKNHVENWTAAASEGVMKSEKSGGRFEMQEWALKITFDVIGIAGLGKDFNILRNPNHPLAHNFQMVTGPHMALYFVLSTWFSFRVVQMLPWDKNRVFREGTEALMRICQQMITDKREAIRKTEKEVVNEDDEDESAKRNGNVDLLSLLIKSGNFEDDEMANQLLTYLVAGHETTSSALTWATYLLSLHPKWQTALRREIHRASLPTSSTTASSCSSSSSNDLGTQIESLPILHGVVQETLRLYPTVTAVHRVAVRDTSLNGVPVPKGTEVLLAPWILNRSQELWGQDAEEFNPARWIDGYGEEEEEEAEPEEVEEEDRTASSTKKSAAARATEARMPKGGRPNNSGHSGHATCSNSSSNSSNTPSSSAYDFVTFLHGPRSCIGQGFARAEMRCLLAALAGRFEWKLDMKETDVVPAGVITINPAKGLWVRIWEAEEDTMGKGGKAKDKGRGGG